MQGGDLTCVIRNWNNVCKGPEARRREFLQTEKVKVWPDCGAGGREWYNKWLEG